MWGPSTTIFLTGSPPFCHIPSFLCIAWLQGGITRQRHGNLSRPVTCCLIQMCCGNSPFHSSSLPDARAPTNLPVTMRMRAAGRPSVCAISRSSPPPFFSSVETIPGPPIPPSRSCYPPASHISISFAAFTSITPSLCQLSSSRENPTPASRWASLSLSLCLTLVHAAIHLSEHHPLTHLQSHLVNCGAKFPLISTPVLWAMEMMRKLRGQWGHIAPSFLWHLSCIFFFGQQMCGLLHERHVAVKWDKMRQCTPTDGARKRSENRKQDWF